MKLSPSRTSLALVAALAVLLAGLVAVTPAGATLQDQVSAAAKQNWHKVWKQKIRPKADRRYYTKKKSDRRYARRTRVWTKAQSDAKYAGAADVWTKGESDSRYQPRTQLVRGTYLAMTDAAAASDPAVADISFGTSLPAAPTAHYIATGAAPPAGCSGSPAEPNADPGHLCVFETTRTNVSTVTLYSIATAANQASPMGAWVLTRSAVAGQVHVGGSWAVRFGGAGGAASAPATVTPPGPSPFD